MRSCRIAPLGFLHESLRSGRWCEFGWKAAVSYSRAPARYTIAAFWGVLARLCHRPLPVQKGLKMGPGRTVYNSL